MTTETQYGRAAVQFQLIASQIESQAPPTIGSSRPPSFSGGPLCDLVDGWITDGERWLVAAVEALRSVIRECERRAEAATIDSWAPGFDAGGGYPPAGTGRVGR